MGRAVQARPFQPPISHRRCQRSGLIGMTERRDMRMRAISAKADSALIAAEVTGFGIGPTAEAQEAASASHCASGAW